MPKRHRWVKLRTHVYICRQRGMGRVNDRASAGIWFTTWHLPTGRSVIEPHVPPCAVGPKTAIRLKHYEPALVVAATAERDEPRLAWGGSHA